MKHAKIIEVDDHQVLLRLSMNDEGKAHTSISTFLPDGKLMTLHTPMHCQNCFVELFDSFNEEKAREFIEKATEKAVEVDAKPLQFPRSAESTKH